MYRSFIHVKVSENETQYRRLSETRYMSSVDLWRATTNYVELILPRAQSRRISYSYNCTPGIIFHDRTSFDLVCHQIKVTFTNSLVWFLTVLLNVHAVYFAVWCTTGKKQDSTYSRTNEGPLSPERTHQTRGTLRSRETTYRAIEGRQQSIPLAVWFVVSAPAIRKKQIKHSSFDSKVLETKRHRDSVSYASLHSISNESTI